MAAFRTLARRFAALYAFVVLLGLAVCAVAILQIDGMGLDARRVVEESREQIALTRALTTIDALSAALASTLPPDAKDMIEVHGEIAAILASLEELEGDSIDPSRAEHQAHELDLAAALSKSLRRLDLELSSGTARWPDPEAVAQLAEVRATFQEILDETTRESEAALRDFERRAGATRGVLLVTLLIATALLCVALALVHQRVVRPIRSLKQAAERLGRGEFEATVDVNARDEIGDLARSFRSMSGRLAETQEDLERRVRERTREFLRAGRLADLGLLASGIAHEINTPLASISSSAEGLTRRLQAGERSLEVLGDYARVIAEEAYRAQEISTRMLALVREDSGQLSHVTLSAVLRQCESALRHRADGRGVRLVTSAWPADARMLVHTGELVQMLVNLLANAVDASQSGGVVRTEARVADGELRVDVTDQGCGIPAEDQERVFEPFFTTKGPGAGTGLGLALVVVMAQSHGGHIDLTSEVGVGSTFTLRVPTDWSRAT